MNPTVFEYSNVVLRWLHVVAGIMWLGLLYWFNFVNAQVVKTYDADTKKKVVPELMPRALYFFRHGALWTWVTGVLLLGLVYHYGGLMVMDRSMSKGAAIGGGFTVMLLAFFAYDAMWKSPLGKKETVAASLSFVLLVALAFGYSKIMSGRAMFIHMGGALGTIMLMNVWMRIWPSQKKVIGGIKGTSPAPDPSVPTLAAMRSKHNVYLSIPLVFFMVSFHLPSAYSHELNWLFAGVFIALGWGIAKVLYLKSASAALTQI
jgi:uncharacterized membrane protein